MKDELEKIFGNKKSGSEELLSQLIDLLMAHCHDKSEITRILKLAKTEMSSFAVIMNFVGRAESAAENYTSERFKLFLEEERSGNEKNIQTLCNNALEVLKDYRKLLTISNSSTVFLVLKRWAESIKNPEVVICEGRPNLEGRNLAEKLLLNGIKVTLITEAQAADYIEKCDAVVAGADKILANGGVLNKTGSRSLAIISGYFNIPFYVIASKNKKTAETVPEIKEYDKSEIWDYRHENLIIKNNYFEIIEASLINRIITD